MDMLKKFIKWNRSLSDISSINNLSEYGAHVEYLRLATILFSAPDVKNVLDIACGSHWQFPVAYKHAYGLDLTGLDIDGDAVNANAALDSRITGDICANPIPDREYFDLLTCYSGVEHFADVEKFLNSAYGLLRPGGALIAQFPSSLAPFALINKNLSHGLKEKILNTLASEKNDELGYSVHYNKCKYSSFKSAAERSGFDIEYYLPSYMSSGYFTFLYPLFCIFQTVDITRLIFGPKDFASYNLFVLRRPGKHFQIKWSWH
jgi:SAM-dependent methyltransferase